MTCPPWICWTALLLLFVLTPGCVLVTVPVKTAGAIVGTTVETTGAVAQAPFKAVSGGYRAEARIMREEGIRDPKRKKDKKRDSYYGDDR